MISEQEKKDVLKREILAMLSFLPESVQRKLWRECKEKGVIK